MDPKDEIKDKIDIAELIAEYLTLKPSGTHSFKGLCPFHGEKTPSFHVSTDKQIWHCFGCNEGGDCFSFVQRMEGMSFPESLIHLGKKVGVEVKRFSTTEGNQKQRLLAMHELAEKFYRKVLSDSEGSKQARAYVDDRGMGEELLQTFAIGYAPDEWDRLCTLLIKRGYSDAEIVLAGLGMKKKRGVGVIDRFRNRIMIPLRDHHGNTVGFTARSMPGDDKAGPKYMNSPQTPIYNKSQLVYGLDLAKQPAKHAGFIIVTEGNLDVVASHKADVKNIVASSGTALTDDQLKLLKRYTGTIVFAFDSDAAGFAAAKKGMTLARGRELDIRAAILPDDVKDPDELVQKDAGAWKQLTENSVPIMEFLISHVTKGKDLSKVDDKRAVGKELLPAISEVQDVVEREHWLQKVSDLLKVDIKALRDSITPKKEVKATGAKIKKPEVEKMSKEDRIGLLVFGYLLTTEDKEILERTKDYRPSSELWITLYKILEEEYDLASNSAQKSIFSRVRNKVDGRQDRDQLLPIIDTSSLLAEQTFADLSRLQVLEQLDNLFVALDRSNTKLRRAELARKLRQAEAAGDNDTVARLLTQLEQ